MKKLINFISNNKFDILSVSLILIIAIILRIIAISNYGVLSQDEPYSWRFASYDSIYEVIKQVIKVDVHTPFYFVLLHIWIKLFGDSMKSLHYSSLIMFIGIIPIMFYATKKLFNKTTAYYSIIFISISTFGIYYSVYTRFYALIMPLSILFSYLFVKMLDKFEKKYVILFVITNIILLYTYTLSSIFMFFTGLVGLNYILLEKRQDLSKFLKIYALITLLSLPAIGAIIGNLILTNSAMCMHKEEFFPYNPKAIYDILENFFSNENFQITSKRVGTYRNFFSLLNNGKYFSLCAIPIFMGIFGISKSLISKNKILYLFTLPSLLTIIFILILASLDVIYYQTKYLLIAYPIIIVAMCYGLTLIKEKIISIVVFLLYISLNLSHITANPHNVLNYKNVGLNYMTSLFYYNDIKETDLIISPFLPEVTKYYFKIGKIVPFALDEGLLIKDKESLKFYFGEEFLSKTNKHNIKEKMYEYIQKDIPMPSYEKNLVENYISKMEKGQKLVVINSYEVTTGPCELPFQITENNYKIASKFAILMTKAIRDTLLIANKNLKHLHTYKNYKEGNSIYIFEKE